jgi:hypothetical protein
MSRTQSVQHYDTPFPDGILTFGITDMVIATGTGTGAYTRLASGSWSLNVSTTTASQIAIPISGILRKYGMQDFVQEAFGNSIPRGSHGQPVGWPNTLSTANSLAGNAINVAVKSSVNFSVGQACLVDTVASTVQETAVISAIPDATHITFFSLANAHTAPVPIAANVFTTPASVTGIPPFTGITELTPVTAVRPKGILIKQITPRYVINTANAATNTIGITETVYAQGASPTATVNTILANAANGLATAFSANVNVTPIPIPVANQKWFMNRNSDIIIEWDITNGSTGTVDLLGIEVDISYNLG